MNTKVEEYTDKHFWQKLKRGSRYTFYVCYFSEWRSKILNTDFLMYFVTLYHFVSFEY